MANKTQLKGRWQEMRGRVQEAWGDLTDDDLDKAEGNWDQLVGNIRQKTGETTETIENKLDEMLDAISDGKNGRDTR